MALPTTLLLSILSLILFPSPSAANEGNILATGEVLLTDGQLSYKDAAFVIKDDCNLVLYFNNTIVFQSDTHGDGFNCTLTLSDYGKLVINSGDGKHVWSSDWEEGERGKYVAVLGPDGNINVFGPSIWSTPVLSFSSPTRDAELNDIPLVRNVLFSWEVLNEGSKLSSRDYTLEINFLCNLRFFKAFRGVPWEIDTNGTGHNCFVRLDNRGQLAIVSDGNKVLWSSKPAGRKGEYVLVVEIHGQAVIYGPVVWSTGP